MDLHRPYAIYTHRSLAHIHLTVGFREQGHFLCASAVPPQRAGILRDSPLLHHDGSPLHAFTAGRRCLRSEARRRSSRSATQLGHGRQRGSAECCARQF